MELIEREPQLKKLNDAWIQVRAGKGRIALVTGEAGIGKTSLLERFAANQGRSGRVLWGACDDLFSPQPLGPFVDIAIQIKSDLLALIQSGADRLTISVQLFTILQNIPTPVILVLEDLHWADEATLDLIKFLGRRIQFTRTLLILSYRDDELSSHHPLHFLLGDMPTHITTRIPLPRLSEQAVQLLVRRAGRPAEDIYTATGGNPFFVSEIIAAEVEGIPTSIRDAVLTRVARLSSEAKDIVELAALSPRSVEIWLLQDILHPKAGAFDECVEGGVLNSVGGSLAFRHELARRSVEDSLPIGRTRDLHTKILGALLSRNTELVTQARLVHHATRAGNEEATLRYAPAAARQASALGAHREAAALYNASLSFAGQRSPAEQAEMYEGLSFENYLIDQVGEALQARKQAALIWERLERYVRAGDCQRWLSRLYWALGNKKEAERYAGLAIEILQKQPPGPELAMAFSNKSQLHMLAWEEEPALEWGHRAMDLAEKLGAVETMVHALVNVGSIELLADFELGKEKIQSALKIAREKALHDHVARCYANLASTSVQFRLYPEAQRWLAEGLEYMNSRDLDFYSVYLLGWLAQMCFETGSWATAGEKALEALRLSRSDTITPLPALITLGHLKVRQGDPSAKAYLDQALPLALLSGELQRIGPLTAARAEAAWWRGDLDAVAVEVASGYELALGRSDPWILGQLAYWVWRAGSGDVPLERLARPYAWMIQGEWYLAAQEWDRIGCPFERAMALAEGDESARIQALAIFEQLGAGLAADWLRNRLEKQGSSKSLPRGSRVHNPKGLDALTPRELEVLRLIAVGLSNPEVAGELMISVGTVKAHTANIYDKLGVNSRVQALVRARELRLL